MRNLGNVYESLGVPVIVNAKGTSTRVSGGIMRPEVADAMREATQHCVDMADLQGRASEIIAGITDAEAGYVTSGATAALMLGAAATVAGLDPAKMERLPDVRGMKSEVVVPRSHRTSYDHAVRAAGVSLVEVGISDRRAQAGVRDTEPWEIAAAINERTAAVLYLANPDSLPSLPEVVAVAHGAGVPVLVDAAAQLPPVANLRRFIAEGADLVAFSGGKAILGPQGSGILCGRRDLIMSAALQNLDLDLPFESWRPPPALIDKSRLAGLPRHGIGRGCKVGKEQVVGLLTALRLFAEEGFGPAHGRWRGYVQELARALAGVPHLECHVTTDGDESGAPAVRLKLDETAARLSAAALAERLERGSPAIYVDIDGIREGVIGISSIALEADSPAVIARRIREALVRP